MTQLLLLVVSYILTGCDGCTSNGLHETAPGMMQSPIESDAPHRQKPSDTSLARRRAILDSLVTVVRVRSKAMKPSDNGAWTDFPNKWTMLEMTDTSFVVYDPCDGDTPTITVGEDSITIGYLWEPMTVPIVDVKMDDRNRAVIEAEVPWCDEPATPFRFEVTILDRRSGLSRWHWSWSACGAEEDRTWLMVPSDRAGMFPTIVRGCKEQKLMEHEFLEMPL